MKMNKVDITVLHGIELPMSCRCLGQSARSAVAEYLQILSGGEGKAKKITLRNPAHPSIEKALEIVRKHFRRLCLEDQGRHSVLS